MTDKNWVIFALCDIKNALDAERYDIATYHINDAIAAILARDDQDCERDDRDRARGIDGLDARARM